MTLTKENTVLNTTDLTDEQKGIVFDIISDTDPSWIVNSWSKEDFISNWGVGILEKHNTIAYNPTIDKEEPYNSELYFKNSCFDKVERTSVTFEQWVELHEPQPEPKVFTAQDIYNMYLDYVDNYTLLTEFAKAYNISALKAGLIINFGRDTKKLLNVLNG